MLRTPALAQEPPREGGIDTLSLSFRSLTIQDGLSQGMVDAITQDRYGFMWFGTKDGLNRYDGYGFKVFRHDPLDSTTVIDSHILSLLEDRTGRFWVGTNSGLDMFDQATETFHHLPCMDRTTRTDTAGAPSGLRGCAIITIAEDPSGCIWVMTTAGLYRIELHGPMIASAVIRPVPTKGTLSDFTIDSEGMLRGSWYGSFISFSIDTKDPTFRVDTIQVVRRSPKGPVKFIPVNMMVAEDTARHRTFGVHANGALEFEHGTGRKREAVLGPWLKIPPADVTVDESGQFWIANWVTQWRFDPNTLRLTRIMPKDPEQRLANSISNIFRDRSGLLWMGTKGYGVLIHDPRIERFHPYSTGSVKWMSACPDGKVVIAQDDDLKRYDPRTAKIDHPVTRGGAIELENVLDAEPSVVQDGDGGFWSNRGCLVRFDPEQKTVRRYMWTNPDGTSGGWSRTFPLYLDGDTVIWFGAPDGFRWFDKRTERFGRIAFPIPPLGGVYDFVQAIHRDRRGIFWLGTMKGLLRLDPLSGEWKHYVNIPNNLHTLSVDAIFSLLDDPRDPDNILWVGTNGGGLHRFDKRTGDVEHYGTREGLPNEVIYGLLSDEEGGLWMSTNKGIARFDPSTAQVRTFDASDGLQGDEFNRYGFCKQTDGALFFGGVQGFNHFRPSDLKVDPRPVQVNITDIKVMNRSIVFGEEGSPLTMPAHLMRELILPYRAAGMLTIDFASMEYGSSRDRQYDYQLEGFDPDRIHAGLSRSANYTNIDPGGYTFKVWGRNRDGVWNEVPTTLRVHILPPWYMTTWAKVLALLSVIGGIVVYNRMRTRSLRRQRDVLEQKVQVRTSELNAALRRSDELLHNILPDEVAAELKEKGEAEARNFDQVTILFSDFKGFTGISEQLTAAELVKELNVCFKAFDGIITARGIEKIKTIGDAYMCAGGLPDPKHGSPADVVHAALEMQAFMMDRKAEHEAQGKPFFEMRVGIHTGPVVAGIVGVKKFQYDIWGDTVNTASRMESSGEVGQVNISGSTYTLVKDEPGLRFTPRGKVQAKGKGEMEMYFVRRSSEGA
jgi:class 3 adenylate cyclase/ligand-binding sensor domain-containing protein